MNQRAALSIVATAIACLGIGPSQAQEQPASGRLKSDTGQATAPPTSSPVTAPSTEELLSAEEQERLQREILDQLQGPNPGSPGRAEIPALVLEEQREAEAFEKALQQTVPLTAGEVEAAKKVAEEVARAAAAPVGVPANAIISSQAVDLGPGSTVPTIRLVADTVSTIVVHDITGQPWPIEAFDVSSQVADQGGGEGQRFKVTQLGENVLTLSSTSHFADGNIAIKLQELPTPLMLRLSQGKHQEADYRKDLHVQRIGPKGHGRINVESLPNHDQAMYLFLDGVPPKNAVELSVEGANGTRAWSYQDSLYLRTPVTLHSPAWLSHTESADGTHVYVLQPTPLLIFSFDGDVNRMKVEIL